MAEKLVEVYYNAYNINGEDRVVKKSFTCDSKDIKNQLYDFYNSFKHIKYRGFLVSKDELMSPRIKIDAFVEAMNLESSDADGIYITRVDVDGKTVAKYDENESSVRWGANADKLDSPEMSWNQPKDTKDPADQLYDVIDQEEKKNPHKPIQVQIDKIRLFAPDFGSPYDGVGNHDIERASFGTTNGHLIERIGDYMASVMLSYFRGHTPAQKITSLPFDQHQRPNLNELLASYAEYLNREAYKYRNNNSGRVIDSFMLKLDINGETIFDITDKESKKYHFEGLA